MMSAEPTLILDWSLAGVQTVAPETGDADVVLRATFRLRSPEHAAPAQVVLLSLPASGVRILNIAGEVVSEGPEAAIRIMADQMAIGAPTTSVAEELTFDIPLRVSIPPLPPMSDPPPYILQLLDVPGLSPDRAWAGFLLDDAVTPRRSPVAASPAPVLPAPPDPGAAPAIDYLARDFDSLTALMVGRMTAHLPADAGARLATPADPLRTIIETLAAAGDYLSYQQDAIGTEASLDSARWRLSIQRHARLLDYVLHDGCNARTWLALEVSADLLLPAGACAISTQAMATQPQLPANFPIDPRGTIAFETMETARVLTHLNDLGPALQRTDAYTIPQGACWAILKDAHPELSVGRTLIFEQRQPSIGGVAFGAHAVRLIYIGQIPDNGAVAANNDEPSVLTVIGWHPEDAMPRDLVVPPTTEPNVALYGNAVLADHGLSLSDPSALGWRTAPSGSLRLTARTRTLTYAAPAPETPIDTRPRSPIETAAVWPSASGSLRQDPARAAAQITLTDQDGQIWTCRRDLFSANPFTRAFVAETGEGFDDTPAAAQGATLDIRFGDGVLGRRQPLKPAFSCVWRMGTGPAGNINAGVLTQIVADAPDGAITAVRNPLPASGGIAPAPTGYGQLLAPTAYRSQLRGVTAGDLCDLALKHPLVTDAAAHPAEQGRGFKVWVALNAPAGLATVRRYLKQFEIIGAPIRVAPPRRVGVDIALTVHVPLAVDAAGVAARLTRDFGPDSADDGTPAFFNPANWRLGQALTLSALVAAIRTDSRISRVETDPRADPRLRFALWQADNADPQSGFPAGRLYAGPGDILEAASDPARPSHGCIVFFVVVGEP